MPHRVPRAAAIAVCLLVALVAAAPQRAVAEAELPLFVPSACLFAPPEGQVEGETLRCGYVIVPADRAHPDGKTVGLPVAVFKARAQTPDPTPMIYLSGGPGGSGIAGTVLRLLNEPEFARTVLAERDLILFDQRGTGQSWPFLACPELEQIEASDPTEIVQNEEGIDPEETPEEEAAELRALHACRERMAAQGIDLSLYGSAVSAADVNDIRRALGYERLNIWGISYGTRLALTIMRDFPEIVRAAVIDGVVPPTENPSVEVPVNAARAFGELFAGCAADAGCAAAFPQLEERFYRLVLRLDDAPAEITLRERTTGRTRPGVLTGGGLLGIVFQALYVAEFIPELPAAIALAADGEYELIARLASRFAFPRPGFSVGVQLTINCAEAASFASAAVYELAIAQVREELQPFNERDFLDDCAVWNVPAAPPVEHRPVVSAIPTLVMSGQFDPITPPRYGDIAARTLANSSVYTYPGVGHGASLEVPCPASMVQGFLRNPTVAPDASCIAEMGPPRWVAPPGR